MSNAESTRLRDWSSDGTAFNPDAAQRDKLAMLYKAGKRLSMDRCLIRAAGETDANVDWMGLVALAHEWTAPPFPITGKDLKAAGVAPGVGMGKTLDALKALWIRSGFTADKPKLLMALRLMGQ